MDEPTYPNRAIEPARARGRRGVSGPLWGLGGLICGALLTVLALVVFAPGRTSVIGAAGTVGGSGTATVSVDDVLLSRLCADGIAQAQLPFTATNVQAHIQPGDLVTIAGDVELFGGLTRPLAVTLRIEAANGQPTVQVTEARVGSLPLPRVVTGLLEDALNQQLAGLGNGLALGGTRYVLTGVETSVGRLVMTFAPAP